MTPTAAVSADSATPSKEQATPTTPPGRETQTRDGLFGQFCSVRQQSLELCAPLSAEDMMVQSCPEASPAK